MNCGCGGCSDAIPILSLLGLERKGVSFECCPLLHREDCEAKSFIGSDLQTQTTSAMRIEWKKLPGIATNNATAMPPLSLIPSPPLPSPPLPPQQQQQQQQQAAAAAELRAVTGGAG